MDIDGIRMEIIKRLYRFSDEKTLLQILISLTVYDTLIITDTPIKN